MSGKPKRSIRVEQKHRRAREEIMQVAQALLSDGGLDAVTLLAVAEELSMTKQAIYHYFPSKEALVRNLISNLLEEEIEVLIAAVDQLVPGEDILAVLINAFYQHYIARLDAFRTIYCQSQMRSVSAAILDNSTLSDEINPRTRHLFDVLENRLSGKDANPAKRRAMRQLAFTAWTSVLGLITMLGVADANNDPLVHTDKELLDTLTRVFAGAEKGPDWQ